MKRQTITKGHFIILRHDKILDGYYAIGGRPLKKGYDSLEKAVSIKNKMNGKSKKYVYTVEEIKF